MSYIRLILAAAAVLLAAAACSTVPYAQRQAQLVADYTAAAGAPVSNFRFLSLYSWVPLSTTELAVYTRPNEAWLLDVDGGCPALTYVPSIGITSYLRQVSINFDKVLTGRNGYPCTITRIRPLDVSRVKAAQKMRREIHTQPRPGQEAEPKA